MRHRERSIKPQCGLMLIVVMIVLVVMAIGGAALMRSVETTTQVSGNLAFKIATLHAGDYGVESAIEDLGLIVATSADARYPAGCTASAVAPNACRYYPTELAVDSVGIPTALNWDNIRYSEPSPGYKVRYVIDRMCNGTLPVTDVVKNCKTLAATNGGTKKAGAVVFTSAGQIYYRITIRVDGPRSTQSYTRAVFSR